MQHRERGACRDSDGEGKGGEQGQATMTEARSGEESETQLGEDQLTEKGAETGGRPPKLEGSGCRGRRTRGVRSQTDPSLNPAPPPPGWVPWREGAWPWVVRPSAGAEGAPGPFILRRGNSLEPGSPLCFFVPPTVQVSVAGTFSQDALLLALASWCGGGWSQSPRSPG